MRISVGLEDTKDLVDIFERALGAVAAIDSSNGTKTREASLQSLQEL